MMVLGISGCAVDIEGVDPAGDEAAVAQVEQGLTSHATRNKRGVVELQVDDESKCTGVMINREYLLTARQCVPDGEYTFEAQAKVSYFDPELPDGEKREVTSGWDEVEVTRHPLWTFDLAIVRRASGWLGTSVSDYQRISQGSCTNIDISSFYGRGSGGPQRGPAGILRAMSVNADDCMISAPIAPNWPSWISDYGPYATCPGDLGGPYLGNAGQYDVIVGILTWMDGGTEACSNGGRDQYAIAFNPSLLNWIEGVINDTCHEFVVEGHEYARCWD